jgi:flotillin
VNEAIQAGGESYFRYRQIEMLPDIVPQIADALASAKLVTITSGERGGAPEATTNNITSVIQTVLAAQLVARSGIIDGNGQEPPSVSAADAKLRTPEATAKR